MSHQHRYKVNVTFTNTLLGGVPKDREVYGQVTHRNNPEIPQEKIDQELETVEESEERGWTGFHMIDGVPALMDYTIKGYFKDVTGMLRRVPGTLSSKIKAYKKIIDGLVFVFPQYIMLDLHGQEMGTSERPLRAQTAQGERIAIARSDTCPKGTTAEFELLILGEDVTEEQLTEWFDYGALRGMGQWRNAGWGTFTYTLEAL